MSELIVERYLNYNAVLTDAVIGQVLGPDMEGQHWAIVKIEPRPDGQPGTFATLAPVKRVPA